MSHAQYTWPSYQYPLTNTANTTNTTNTANTTNNTLWQLMLGCKPGLPDKRWRWPVGHLGAAAVALTHRFVSFQSLFLVEIVIFENKIGFR